MSKTLSSTALYAYTTLISVLICLPLALIAEGATLQKGIDAAIVAVGWAVHIQKTLLSCAGKRLQVVLGSVCRLQYFHACNLLHSQSQITVLS